MEPDNIATVIGQITSSYIPYVDLRDVLGNLVHEDYVFAGLSLVGLLPVAGDALKISANVSKYILKNVDNISDIAKLLAFLNKNSPDVVKVLAQNDEFVSAAKKLSSSESLKITKNEAESINKVLNDAGLSQYVIKGGTSTLKHQATSGVELISTPGKTTTILGRYGSDTGAIIDELGLPKSTDFSGNPGGFNLLNTPDELYEQLGPDGFWNQYNKPFLDAAIERGDEILMATPINNSTLYTTTGDLTGYGREYYYLLSKGYEYVDGKMILKGAN